MLTCCISSQPILNGALFKVFPSLSMLKFYQLMPLKTKQCKINSVVQISISYVWSNGYFPHCKENRVKKESNLLFAVFSLEFQVALTFPVTMALTGFLDFFFCPLDHHYEMEYLFLYLRKACCFPPS